MAVQEDRVMRFVPSVLSWFPACSQSGLRFSLNDPSVPYLHSVHVRIILSRGTHRDNRERENNGNAAYNQRVVRGTLWERSMEQGLRQRRPSAVEDGETMWNTKAARSCSS
jgi:hypothetical protein